MICAKSRIGKDAHLKGPLVIGPGCQIGDGAVIESSILWQDVEVEPEAVLKQCIIDSHTRLECRQQTIGQVVCSGNAGIDIVEL